MLKLNTGWMRIGLCILMFAMTACNSGGGGGGGGDDDTEILARIVNQHTMNGLESEIRLDQFWYCNSSNMLGSQILRHGQSTDWFDIGHGANRTMCSTASLDFSFREQDSSGLWSNLESEHAEEISGQDLYSGEKHTIVITGNGATVVSGAVKADPKVYFHDTDSDPGQVAGVVSIVRAADESTILTYELHWGLDRNSPLSTGSEIASWTPADSDISHTFGPNTPVPAGATHLLLYTTTATYPDGNLWSQVFADMCGTVLSPQPQGNDLNGIAYGNGRYVAVGNRGTILSSTNGIDWVPQSSGTIRKLNGIIFDQDRFLVAGDGVFLAGSSDATEWSLAVANTGSRYTSPAPEIELYNIDKHNGLYLAAGEQKSVLVSQDGSTWLVRESGGSYGWHATSSNGAVYVAAGRGIATSEDNIAWGEQLSGGDIFNAGNNVLRDILYHDGNFLAVGAEGKLLTSADGADWDMRTIEHTSLCGIIYADDRYIIVGGSNSDEDATYTTLIMTSDDGISWDDIAVGTLPFLYDIVHADGLLVAVGADGLILTSDDGDTWIEQSTGPYENINAVAAGAGGTPFAVGDKGFIASWNGSGWDRIPSGVSEDLQAILYDGGLPGYVVVGDNSTVLTSADADTWTLQSNVPEDIHLQTIAYGDGVYLASGFHIPNGMTIRSTNGTDWSAADTGTTAYFTCIMYADNQFVAGGNFGLLRTSPDGAGGTWTQRDPATSTFLAAIVAANGFYYASGGYDGTVVASDDLGATWSELNSDSVSYFKTRGLAVDGSRILSAGAGAILFSPDGGHNWWEQKMPVDGYLNDVFYTGTQFLAVGRGGVTAVVE